MDQTQLSLNYRMFLTLLNDKQVEYLLVGGFAVRYYGYLRPTQDLDVWIATHPDNATKLVEVCQTFGSGVEGLTLDTFLNERHIIRINIPPLSLEILHPIVGQKPEVLERFLGKHTNCIEILTIQSGVNFAECFSERVTGKLDGVAVNFISFKHLKVIKQVGARHQDLIDIENLRS
jgi:hypothetical protein